VKISILSFNLSNNGLGRAYLLAEVLSRRYEVEIIGPVYEDEGIWPPLKDAKIKMRSVPLCRFPKFFRSIRDMLRMIDGDVIYAIKPRPTSFGIGLIKKLLTKKPLVLDIDDLEEAFTNSRRPPLRHPDSLFYLRVVRNFVRYADEITTVSEYLRNAYGVKGITVLHGRNTEVFNPDLFDPIEQKTGFNLQDSKIIAFLGNPISHKGIEDIVEAIKLIKDRGIKLVISGASNKTIERLIRENPDMVVYLGITDFDGVPKILSMADMVVLPQRNEPEAYGQVPMKLFDAMAMAKPIISTNISEMPKILDGCGLIVEPGDVAAIAEKIRYILDNPDEARAMGRAAREKCKKYYSYDAMEAELLKVFGQYEKASAGNRGTKNNG